MVEIGIKDDIKKLIAEYEQKIINCEKVLEPLAIKITELRRAKSDYSCFLKEQSIYIAQKQSYIQAKHDFCSLLIFF